jgi:anti-sigma B factor antagonist
MAVSRSGEDEGTVAMPFSRSELEPFRCEVHPARAAVQVRPVGELDVATVPVVDAELADLWAVGFSNLVLDLRKVCFLDSTGVHLLCTWTAACEADGIVFRVIPGPPAVQRVIELAGLSDRLPFTAPNGTGQRPAGFQ